MALATIEIERFHYESAAILARSAVEMAMDDYPHAVAAKLILARVHKDHAEWDQAEACLAEADKLAESAGLTLQRLASTLLRGWLNYTKSVVDECAITHAEDCFRRALSVALVSKRMSYAAEARVGLAWCALAHQRTDEAQNWLAEVASAQLTELHSGLAAIQLLCTAAVLHQQLKFSEAMHLYERAIEFARQTGDLACECDAWTGKGSILWHGKNAIDANVCWETAAAIAAQCSPVRKRLASKNIERSQRDPKFTPQ